MSAVVQQLNGDWMKVPSHGYCDMSIQGRLYCGQYLDREFLSMIPDVMDKTSLNLERLWMLYHLAKQSMRLNGDFYECGVHLGGTAKFLTRILGGREIHLFDTFCGMPEPDPEWDTVHRGDFGDTSVGIVKLFLGDSNVSYHEGMIPQTFIGMNDEIAFAHVDVDIRKSIYDCCEFIYPRLIAGGVLLIDDYGQESCPGTRKAVDDYFQGKRSIPLPLLTGQAVIFKI